MLLEQMETMSKSKNNIINIFQEDNLLKKQVMKIKTESIAIGEPKNPNNCNVFKIFSLIANEKDINVLKKGIILVMLDL